MGLIDYNGDSVNSKKCTFKKELESKKQLFSPHEIKAYRFIDDKYYISHAVSINGNQEFVFLEFLINGIVDIYFYRTSQGDPYYFLKTDDNQLRELKNEENELFLNGTKYIKESNEYKGVLKVAFQETPSIFEKVNNTSLSRKSLINIAQEYHNEVCSTEDCIIYEKKKDKPVHKFGVLVGLNIRTNYDMTTNADENDLYFLESDAKLSQPYPSVGFFYRLNFPSIYDKLFLQYEGTFSKYTLNWDQTSTLLGQSHLGDVKSLQHHKLTQNSINNSLSVRLDYPQGKIRPTCHLGVFYNFLFNIDHTYTYKLLDNETLEVTETSEKNSYSNKTYDTGIAAGLGIIFELLPKHEVFIDFNYQGQLFGPDKNDITTNYFFVNIGYEL